MQSRTCTVVNKAISKDGKPRLFAKALEFGGFDDSLGVHREQPFVAAADRVTVETATMGDVLAESGAPPTIHYLNIDTEGSELEILRSFPFDKHSVHCITLEHNYEEPKRSEMHALLTSESNGFLLAYSVDWDDWFVHRSMQAQLQVLYDTVMPAPQKAS
jgi:FkbM family methyltransferase